MNIVESLQIFRRVAQKQSFSQVAAEFKVTQPTISKSVAQLERTLGVSLFRRTTRGLSLTSEGQKLFNSSGPVLDLFDSVIASVKSEKQQLRGQIRVTASLAFARLILSSLFNDFSSLHPDLKFHFHLSDGYVDLVENNIDVAIRIGELQDSSLKALKVGQSKRNFYASKAYLKKFGQPKNLDDLKNHRLLFFTRLSDRPAWPLLQENKKIQFQFDPYLQSDGSDLIREAVLEGVGISLLPSWMMIGHGDKKIEVLSRFTGPASPVHILSNGNKDQNIKQKTISEFLKKRFDEIPELSLRQN